MHYSWLLLFFYYQVCVSDTNPSKQPNIVVIMADDLGWNDFSFHGSNQIPTPNIDALAYNGIIMNTFYTLHSCTPSRTALLTGMHPIHAGLQGLPIAAGNPRALPLDVVTLPQHLKKLNYSTHLVGKWHLGAAHRKDLPTNRGFDTHFGYWHGFIGYFNHIQAQPDANKNILRGLDFHDGFEPLHSYDGKYATDLFTEKSLEVIDKHDKETPLFLVVSHLAGHTGDNDTELGVPDEKLANEKYNYIKIPERRLYADIVSRMDDSVGQIVQKLSEENMLQNSIILFFSDNGAPTAGLYKNFGSNWPLRGMKLTLFEGAVKGIGIIFSPLFKSQPYVNNELIHLTDLMPTLYHAAGGDVNTLGNIDGYNQWSSLAENTPSVREGALLNIDESLEYSGIIGDRGRYKLINGSYQHGSFDGYFGDEFITNDDPAFEPSTIIQSITNRAIEKLEKTRQLTEDDITRTRKAVTLPSCARSNDDLEPCLGYCLFDLVKDPCETRNIIDEMPVVAERLKDKLKGYYKNLRPQASRIVDAKANPVYYNGTWCTWLDDEWCSRTDAHVSIIQRLINNWEWVCSKAFLDNIVIIILGVSLYVYYVVYR